MEVEHQSIVAGVDFVLFPFSFPWFQLYNRSIVHCSIAEITVIVGYLCPGPCAGVNFTCMCTRLYIDVLYWSLYPSS